MIKKDQDPNEKQKEQARKSLGEYGIMLDEDMTMIHPVGKASGLMSPTAKSKKDEAMQKRAKMQAMAFAKAKAKTKLSDVLIPVSKTRKKG